MNAKQGIQSLWFHIELLQVYFTQPGRYYLKLTINSNKGQRSDIQLYVNEEHTSVKESEISTEFISQNDVKNPVKFKESKFTFCMPSVFASGEVRLNIEAYQVFENSVNDEEKCGECMFLVYPRPYDAAKLGTTTSDNLYHFETQLQLSHELSSERIRISTGILKAVVSLKMQDENKNSSQEVPKWQPLSVVGDLSAPGPSADPGNYQLIDRETITDTALESSSPVAPLIHLCGSYLAGNDKCEVAVLVHTAVGLPSKANGSPPRPYVTACTKGNQEHQGIHHSITHAAKQPTYTAAWDEVVLVKFPEEQAKQEDILLTIADHPSREVLAQFQIPVAFLKPFHLYHLELVQPRSEVNGDTKLSISIILKKPRLELGDDDTMTYGLEMTVLGFDNQVVKQAEPLIAVARIVPEWSHYRNNFLIPAPRPAGVTVRTIRFPSPHPSSFAVAGALQPTGSPQVTVASESNENPQWNQTFYFPGGKSSLFAPGSSLIIEYFSASSAISRGFWQLSNPVAYSHHDLDESLLSSLKHENGKLGLRIVNLPVEGADVDSTVDSIATVGLAVRLLGTDKPHFHMTAAQLSTLPIYQSGLSRPAVTDPHEEPQFAPSKQNRFGFPECDAVRKLLPNYHSLCISQSPQPVKEYIPIQGLETPTNESSRYLNNNNNLEIPENVRSNLDVRSLAVLDNQMKEIDHYRTVMRKMASDLLHLREDKARLEGANSRLRRELEKHDEISRMMVNSHELDSITHSELIQKFALLKRKLADESTKKQELQTRVQHLQNELIKKNEIEKEFIRLQDAHNGQQRLLQKLQGKVQKTKTLQDTCKKQEKVIVELEELMARRVEDGATEGKIQGNALQNLLKEENEKLRTELLHLKELLRVTESKLENTRTSTNFAQPNGTFPDQERLEMFEKLEKAEGRILALERELTNNARAWAKEKAELQLKLNESQIALHTGYRNSTTDLQTLHNAFNDAVITPPLAGSRRRSQPPPGPRRPSPKLDPLKRWPEYK